MNIGKAAERSGVPAKTIRYYESIGLVKQVVRTEGNYRDYSDSDVETLKFISRARSLGFSVKEVGDLLTLWHDRDRASAEVKRIAQGHVEAIERKIAELQSIRDTLNALVEQCHGDGRPDCPILEGIAHTCC